MLHLTLKFAAGWKSVVLLENYFTAGRRFNGESSMLSTSYKFKTLGIKFLFTWPNYLEWWSRVRCPSEVWSHASSYSKRNIYRGETMSEWVIFLWWRHLTCLAMGDSPTRHRTRTINTKMTPWEQSSQSQSDNQLLQSSQITLSFPPLFSWQK